MNESLWNTSNAHDGLVIEWWSGSPNSFNNHFILLLKLKLS